MMGLATGGAFAGRLTDTYRPEAKVSQVNSSPLTGAAVAVAPSIPDTKAASARPNGIPDAFVFLAPSTIPGTCPAPPNGGTVAQGCRFVLDMMVNAGTNAAPDGVTAQQSYLTFTFGTIQNARVSSIATSCTVTNTVTQDNAVFDAVLQNEVCNGPGQCNFRGLIVDPGSISVATGGLNNCPEGCPDGDHPDNPFRTAEIGLCAVNPGVARLHWQFSSGQTCGNGAPATRDSEVVAFDGDLVQNCALYTDYTFTVVGNATATPSNTTVPTNTSTSVPTNTDTAVPTNTNTSVPTNTNTSVPTNTNTAVATNTNTSVPTNTNTSVPTNTNTSVPTNTNTSVPTNTNTSVPTNTNTSVPTNTNTSVPTNTNTSVPTNTNTSVPTNTNTSVPTNTNTSVPTNTNTSVPTNTNTSVPTNTNTAAPTNTGTHVPEATNTNTAVPTETNTSVPTNTNTSVPTNTNTSVPTNTNTAVATNTNTSVPTNTNTSVPTNTFTNTPTRTITNTPGAATNTRTRTRTPAATPCDVCNLYFADTNIACNPDGTVHWQAVVRNNGSCTVTTPYKVQLQVRHGYNGQFVTVEQRHYTGVFPPGDTEITGDICHQFSPADDFMRIYIALDSTTTRCNADHLSPFIDVCNHPTACPPGLTFNDVPNTSSFYNAVSGLVSGGAISGYTDGTFRPANTTTRAQVAKIVTLAFGIASLPNASAHFSDVPVDHPFFAYVEAAYARGLVGGYGDGTFRPYNNVTRGQVAKMVVLAAGYALVTPATPTFSDVAADSPYYSYVETAYANHALSGYGDGTFRPANNATRAQIAQIAMSAATVQEAKLPWGAHGRDH
jgi:hypothetical protein